MGTGPTGEQQPESLLVADLGRGRTRAVLLERIDGAMRFVAKAEHQVAAFEPAEDVPAGWYGLLDELQRNTGHRLLERDRQISPQQARGDGVDGVLVCSAAEDPVRAVVLEAGADPAVTAATDALRRSRARLLQVTALAGKKVKAGEWVAAQSAAIRTFKPDVTVVLAGSDTNASNRLAQILHEASDALADSRVVVVADPARQQQCTQALGGKAHIRGIEAKGTSPAALAAEIERHVAEIGAARSGGHVPPELSRESGHPAVGHAHAVDLVTRFVARAFARQVVTLGLDDGAHAHWASGEQGAMAALSNLDLGPNITALTEAEAGEAAQWLPFAATPDELITWVLNRAIRPWSRPDDAHDLAIEQALTRHVLRRAILEIAQAHPLALQRTDLAIGGSWLARWNQPGAAALVLLDSLDVVPDQGILDLALDRDGLMPVAGTLATLDPGLASDLFEYDGLIHLGSAIVVGGAARPGELACRGELEYEDGEVVQFSVASGTIDILPLRPGETASLTLRPERKFSIGGNPSGKAVSFGGERRVIGGAVGVVLDARGRSLAGDGSPNRQQRVKQWLDVVNGVAGTRVRRRDG